MLGSSLLVLQCRVFVSLLPSALFSMPLFCSCYWALGVWFWVMFLLYADRTLPLFWILYVALAPPTSITLRSVTRSLGITEAVFLLCVCAVAPLTQSALLHEHGVQKHYVGVTWCLSDSSSNFHWVSTLCSVLCLLCLLVDCDIVKLWDHN